MEPFELGSRCKTEVVQGNTLETVSSTRRSNDLGHFLRFFVRNAVGTVNNSNKSKNVLVRITQKLCAFTIILSIIIKTFCNNCK